MVLFPGSFPDSEEEAVCFLQEQLAAANQAEAEKSDRIRELEEQVSNLKEQLAAAVSKSETEDRGAEPPVESKDQTADAEQQALTKRPGKKNTASPKAKTKTKAATKGQSHVSLRLLWHCACHCN